MDRAAACGQLMTGLHSRGFRLGQVTVHPALSDARPGLRGQVHLEEFGKRFKALYTGGADQVMEMGGHVNRLPWLRLFWLSGVDRVGA